MRVDKQLIGEHLQFAHDGEADRVRTLRNLFHKAGCRQVLEQEVPKEEFPNLICLLPGEEEGTIIVGASLDYEPEDAQTPAKWSALAMLPLLAESLSLVPHRFTLMLVAFTGHDREVRGATWYLNQLTEAQRKPIRAMVDLDNLGRAPPVYALAQSDKTLATWLNVAATSLQFQSPPMVDASAANLPQQIGVLAVKDEDLWANAKPFERAHIPAISVQSATPAMLLRLHQDGSIPARVTGATFDLDTYEDTYRLMSVYVLYLDRNLGRPLVEPGTYSGQIIDTAGVFASSPIELSVRIGHFTPSSTLYRYELVLQKDGQDGLADALDNENEKGNYRFGLNLAYGAKIIVLQNSGKEPHVLLIGTRLKRRGSTARDYRFMAIRLNLDSKGNGDGSFYNSVKLRFNKKHELEIEDFGSKPDDIRQVRLEQPSLPKTTPATAVATANPPASAPNAAAPAARPEGTPQSGNAPVPPPATAATDTTPVFKAKAQLVQLDVAVTDAKGNPVAGLQQSDFTVLEDGKPQEIRVFEPHTPSAKQTAAAPVQQVSLPPHTYTNRVVTSEESSFSILLLDLWNTPLPDQAYARDQAIAFLKTLPKGKTLAMFVLGSRLTMIQGFTDDSPTLVAAAEKVTRERSLQLTTDAERQTLQGSTEEIARFAGTAPPANAGPSDGGGGFGFAQQREQSNTMMEATRTAGRVSYTLDALTALARSVSSYPGRKNLVWLSGSFPVQLKPTVNDKLRPNVGSTAPTTGMEADPNFGPAVRAATTALATARLAVYPIDVRGIQISGVDLTVSASESHSFAGTDNPTAFTQNLNSQSASRYEERSAMKQMAEQTGGEVLAGNDVKGAIGKAIDDGSTYYAMAYTPARDQGSQDFHKIEVKVSRPGLKLAYRPGYFPNGKTETSPKTHPLILAMQPGVPASTVIPVTVEVLPPDSGSKKVRINYTIDIQGIVFADTPEHRKRAVIDCVAVAFTREGAPAGQISNTMDATLPVADYNSALQTGLKMQQELELPPGQYDLRVGVMERESQKIGTLDAPVTVAAPK
jgi:VWFA-related protein